MGIMQSSPGVNYASPLSYFLSPPDSSLCTHSRDCNQHFPLTSLCLSRRAVGSTRGRRAGIMEERQAHAMSLLFHQHFPTNSLFPRVVAGTAP